MDPVTVRRWQQRGQVDKAWGDGFGEALGLSLPVAQVFAARGLTEDAEVDAFLNARLNSLPDPFLMSGMTQAVDRVVRAITDGEKILVHGDYDVDGVSGTTLLVETLRGLGAEVDYHIPLRLTEGYGLSAGALEQAASRGIRVVLSVDCGVSATEEALLARRLGIDLLVTDHHLPPAQLPEVCAMVNPRLPGCPFPDKHLAGVGVAFFFLIALRKTLRDVGYFTSRPEPDLRTGLDLVALGTIADVVPLVGVNRVLVRVGLDVLERGSRVGIHTLKTVAGVDKVNCGAVGFRLAPRLNAAGRLEDAGLGVTLLLEDDPHQASGIARTLDTFNRERQSIEEATLHQALEKLQGQDSQLRTIVLGDERWHPGVIGIVASRLVERFHRPVVLIAFDGDQGKGSARSIPGFDLFRALQGCSSFLTACGGHEAAAGLSIKAVSLEGFANAFEAEAQRALCSEDLFPCLFHDGELAFEDLHAEHVEQLGSLAPFGVGNPEPSFVACNLSVRQLQVLGTDHLRFTACQGGYSFNCIAFGMAERRESLCGPVDLLFSPTLNTWRGQTSVQLKVRDFRPSPK